MSKWFKKPEPVSWSGEPAGTSSNKSAADEPCAKGHNLAFTRTESTNIYGKEIRISVYECARGCGYVEKKHS